MKEYHPSFSDHWVLAGYDAIYGLPHPTIAQIINEQGYDVACEWVYGHVVSLFTLSSMKPDSNMLVGLSRTIAVRYKHLMLPEFIHFCFLYRAGEFTQTLSKPCGDNVLRALREYSAMRLNIIADLHQRAEMPSTTDRHPMTPEIEKMIADFFASEARRQGSWRQEPWGTAICRAYFVDKTLSTFPGDMTPAQRESWVRERGLDEGMSL